MPSILASTWKVAKRPSHTNNTQKPLSPKPKKQPKTQNAKAESRNFHRGKSRDLKISSKNQPKTKKQETPQF